MQRLLHVLLGISILIIASGSIVGCSASPAEIAGDEYLSTARERHLEFYKGRLQEPLHVKVAKGELAPPMNVRPGSWTIYEFADFDDYVSTLHLHAALGPTGRSADDLQPGESFRIDMSVLLDSSRTSRPYEYWNGSLSSEQCKDASPVAGMFEWEDTNRGVYQHTPSRAWNAKRRLVLSVRIGDVQKSLKSDEFITLTPELFWSK